MKYYKAFRIGWRGELVGPISDRDYHVVGGRKPLTPATAVGATVQPVKGRLSLCMRGYHMYNSRQFGAELHFRVRDNEVWYEVEPIDLDTSDLNRSASKVLARGFRIIRQLRPWELRRIHKDRYRSHKRIA